MKILITGANGVIGSDLVNFFSKDCKVFAIYRTSNNIIRKVKNKNINWIKHDLSKRITKKIKPEIVIHCAVTHTFSKKTNFSDYINSNIIGLKNILEFCKINKVKKFFHLSTINIYGNINYNKLDETHSFNNPNLLGATKILMEKSISLQDFNYLNLRLPGVVGYLINDPRRPWFCKIINSLNKNKKIEIFNSNKKFNNLIDSYEIYKFIKFLKNKKNFLNGSVNFCARNPITLKKIIVFSKKILNSKSKIIYNKRKSVHFTISSKKVSLDYGFDASNTLEIVYRYLEYFKKNFKKN